MAIIAKLQFGDNASRRYAREYLVTDFKCHVSRRHNEARPDSRPRCESLELTVVAPGRDDLNLTEWYVGETCMSGRLLVELPAPSPNQPPQWKEVLFENGLCYGLAEDYHIDERVRRSLRLSIVAEEMTIDTIEFKP